MDIQSKISNQVLVAFLVGLLWAFIWCLMLPGILAAIPVFFPLAAAVYARLRPTAFAAWLSKILGADRPPAS